MADAGRWRDGRTIAQREGDMKKTADRMEAQWYESSAPVVIERDEDALLRYRLRKLVMLVDSVLRGLEVD